MPAFWAIAPLTIAVTPVTRAPWREEVGRVKASIPGQFSFEGLLMDEYSVEVSGLPAEAYLKDVTYGGRSILGRPLRAGSEMGNALLRIVLARDGGGVTCKAVDKDDNPIADAAVAVMPASAISEAELAAAMVVGQTDQNGDWSSAQLAPGKYYLTASSTALDLTPESVAALWRAHVSKAKEIEITSGAAVKVNLTPAKLE